MPKKLDVTNAFYDLLVSKTTVITRDIYRIFPSVQTFYRRVDNPNEIKAGEVRKIAKFLNVPSTDVWKVIDIAIDQIHKRNPKYSNQ